MLIKTNLTTLLLLTITCCLLAGNVICNETTAGDEVYITPMTAAKPEPPKAKKEYDTITTTQYHPIPFEPGKTQWLTDKKNPKYKKIILDDNARFHHSNTKLDPRRDSILKHHLNLKGIRYDDVKEVISIPSN